MQYKINKAKKCTLHIACAVLKKNNCSFGLKGQFSIRDQSLFSVYLYILITKQPTKFELLSNQITTKQNTNFIFFIPLTLLLLIHVSFLSEPNSKEYADIFSFRICFQICSIFNNRF